MAARRTVARTLVLILAGLAVAGTSASPQPPPLATAKASGRLEVTAERPIASVVVTLAGNAAARSIAGSRIVSRVAGGASSLTNGPTILVVEPLDRPGANSAYGSSVDLLQNLDDGCPALADCSQRFRISAVLLDPETATAGVDWQATAELRADGPNRPSSAPAGARLDATAGDPASRPAAELARTGLPAETVHVDAVHPLASRFLDLTLPAGVAGVTGERTVLAFLTVSSAPVPNAGQPAGIRLGVPGELGPLTTGQAGRSPFFPAACAEAAGCTTALRLDLTAPSGNDVARDVDWSVTVVGFGPPGADPPDHLGIKVTGSADLGPTSPAIDATQTGTFEVRKLASGSKVAIVTIDAATVAQSATPIRGFLQIQYALRSTGPVGERTLNLGVGADVGPRSVPNVYGQLKEGGSTILSTAVVAADCEGRSRCEYGVPFFTTVSDDGPAIPVEWTISARWFADLGEPIPAGLQLTNRISEAPSARP